MEWPPEIPTLTDDYLGYFGYEARPLHCSVAQSGNPDVKRTTDAGWHTWFAAYTPSLTAPLPPSPGGFCVVICGRPAQQLGGVPAQISSVPFRQETFKTMADTFHIHPAIVRPITRGETYFSVFKSQPHVVNGQPHPRTTYIARMSKFWPQGIAEPGDIALTATYFPNSRLTLSVVYGCQSSQGMDIKYYLTKAGAAAGHPLLMMGIFAEQQRTVLADFVKKTTTQCVEVEADLSGGGSPRFMKKAFNLQTIRRLQTLGLASNELIKELKAAQRQISKMILHSKCLAMERFLRNDGNQDGELALRYTERLMEIDVEYEEMIQKTRMNFDQLKHTMEIISSHLERQNAEANTLIAIVAMFYLPITSVAAVFTIPIFKWDEEPDKIANKWLALYFGVTIIVGSITFSFWWYKTRSKVSS